MMLAQLTAVRLVTVPIWVASQIGQANATAVYSGKQGNGPRSAWHQKVNANDEKKQQTSFQKRSRPYVKYKDIPQKFE